MNPEQQRIAIAKACGWTIDAGDEEHSASVGTPPNAQAGVLGQVPDYLNDLNAMHEAEEKLSLGAVEDFSLYCSWLQKVAEEKEAIPLACWITKATAAQRAEAFLKTYNLWKD